jgi:hypothetical protein
MVRILKQTLMLAWCFFFFYPGKLHAAVTDSIALTPPMGWNSYDCYCYTVNEAQVKANTDYMADSLKKFGWQYIVIDYVWSAPIVPGIKWSPSQDANFQNPHLNMDQYGRQLPDTTRFPSAKGGNGFKPIADYVHGKGLKFGIHIMRGILRQAWAANCPILGSTAKAKDVANTSSTCSWLNHMYGLDMTKAGAQAYLNSILNLYASWNVDFIKVDDLSRPYYADEIVGYRTAINQCGRPILFSTSPGKTPLTESSHVSQYANQWRLLEDFWDSWAALDTAFNICASWTTTFQGVPGHWPDPDMLPLGALNKYGPTGDSPRNTNFTHDEQYTLMSLWSIFRAPLIFGGNLPENDAFTNSLLMNSEVIKVDQTGVNVRVITNGNLPVWASDSPDSSNVKYVALFNRTETGPTTVMVDLNALGMKNSIVRNLWTKTNVGTFATSFSSPINKHGAGLFKLTTIPTAAKPSSPVVAYVQSRAFANKTFTATGNTFSVPVEYRNLSLIADVYTSKGSLEQSSAIKNGAMRLQGAGVYFVKLKIAR